MEESIMDFMAEVRKTFDLDDTDIRTYSPLTLAYVGDAVYELVIRSLLTGRGNAQVNRLHKKASSLVNAGAQSESLERIREALTEEELHVFRRGRNANSATMARHATMTDYRKATGFEALMGYLYLTGQTERMLSLIRLGLQEDAAESGSRGLEEDSAGSGSRGLEEDNAGSGNRGPEGSAGGEN